MGRVVVYNDFGVPFLCLRMIVARHGAENGVACLRNEGGGVSDRDNECASQCQGILRMYILRLQSRLSGE